MGCGKRGENQNSTFILYISKKNNMESDEKYGFGSVQKFSILNCGFILEQKRDFGKMHKKVRKKIHSYCQRRKSVKKRENFLKRVLTILKVYSIIGKPTCEGAANASERESELIIEN